MIKYRLKFEFKKEDDPTLDRENHLNGILSEIDSIVSDTPIRKPMDGEIILISKEEYRVCSVVIAFDKEDDIIYHDFIILLENKRNIEDRKKKKEEEIRLKEEKDRIERLVREQSYKDKISGYHKHQDPYKDTYKQYPKDRFQQGYTQRPEWARMNDLLF